jgi:hypothetical protein
MLHRRVRTLLRHFHFFCFTAARARLHFFVSLRYFFDTLALFITFSWLTLHIIDRLIIFS